MNCRFPFFCLGIAATLCATAASARAQNSIVFSKPADPVDTANAFVSPSEHKLVDSSRAPTPLFGRKPSGEFDVLPGAQKPRSLSPEQSRQAQKFFDEQNNWILRTPAEIMDVPTVEKILGIPDPDQDLSVRERYLKRREQQRSGSVTNALAHGIRAGNQDESPFAAWRGEQKRNAAGELIVPNAQKTAGGFLTGQADQVLTAEEERRAHSPWNSAFAVPPPLPKPDLAQQASMERFRVMMNPPAPEKPLVSAPVAPAPNPNFQPLPKINPAGNSARPMEDGIGRPMGLMPLPTVTGVRPGQLNAPKPKPLVEPPPWVAQDKKATPKPGVFPQRKF